MKILIIGTDQDTGAQGWRIREAFRHCAPDWKVDSMHQARTYHRYPRHLAWDREKAERLYAEADVVHHRNGLAVYEMFDRDQRKPAIVHHHGSRLRHNPQPVTAEAKSVGAVELTSTVDLLADAPGATWMPAPLDLDWIAGYRHPLPPGGPIRIMHSPTHRGVKGTEVILRQLEKLQARDHVELDLTEQRQWKVCLVRKGLCDIFIDQITYGYGNNAIEAMAMGVPVVSGWGDPSDRARFVAQTGEEPPFMEASASNLAEQVDQLCASPSLRAEWGERGRAFVERWHTESRAVEQLRQVYAAAPATRGIESLQRFQEAA